jgi:ParB/RepB/Spo0J family partition protein
MEIQEMPLDKLVPSRNLRTEGVDIVELVESIREHGLLQPIRVRPLDGGIHQIIAGHRRYLAHRELGRKTISAVIVNESDEAAAVQSIVENLQRENLTPLELAGGIRELATSFSLAPNAIAKAISKSSSQVQTWIRLSRLPDDVLTKLQSGEGRQQVVTSLTPRHIQPFVSDIPSPEEADRDPTAKARFDERVTTARRFTEEVDKRGVRLNAHMADAVARRVKSGQTTVSEAMDEVLAHPEEYRYTHAPIQSVRDLEESTWAAYKKVHDQMNVLVYKLRPEIAGSFSREQKSDLLDRVLRLIRDLERYRSALEPTDVVSSTRSQRLNSLEF